MSLHLRDQRGQSVALFAVALLLVALMTFFTISTGNRLQEKIKTQAAADAAAYGLAVSQARAMNVMAMANRAIVGEYVSSLSVASHVSWMNIYEWTFDMQAELWQKLKADKNAECALYQYCHSAVGHRDPSCRSPTVCCKGPSGGCCDPHCDYYNCYAAACSVPDSLFDTISDDWYQGFGTKSWKGIHSKWHEYPKPKIKALAQYASDYVNQAWRASDQGVAAFNAYTELLQNQAYAQGLAATVDPRMTEARSASNPHAPAQATGAQQNLKSAVEIFPATAGAGALHDRDFDVFNEILTGTRGGGQNNYDSNPMTWEPQHGAGPGYFDDDNAALPGICARGSFHPGPWPQYACSAAWDENTGAVGAPQWADNDGVANNYKGGAMMLTGSPGSIDDILAVNTGNLHNYTTGDLGGRRALSAADHAMTTASFAVDQISCPGYPTVLPGKSLVCLSETGRRVEAYAEVAHNGQLACMRSFVKRGAGDDPNPAKGYNVSDDTFNAGICGNDDTEVGFFRFNITNEVNLNPQDPTAAVNLFNQPFTYAATQLDATHDQQGHHLPWDFQLGKVGGSLLKLDQSTDEHGAARSTNDHRDGTTFSGNSEGYNSVSYPYVRGFSSGLTYYHNPGSWKEVPNLFNPYWRAKLAPPGAHALENLDAISRDDCEVGKALGYVNDVGASANNGCR